MLHTAPSFVVARGAGTQAAGGSSCALRFRGFAPARAESARPSRPPDTKSRGRPFPMQPTPSRCSSAAGADSSGDWGQLCGFPLPDPALPGTARLPSSSLPTHLRRLKPWTLRRGRGPGAWDLRLVARPRSGPHSRGSEVGKEAKGAQYVFLPLTAGFGSSLLRKVALSSLIPSQKTLTPGEKSLLGSGSL